MSWKATAYVKEMITTPNGEKITQGEKLLLFVLADYHHTQRGVAWPSVPLMATESLMDERTARRHLRSLEEKGVLECIRPDKIGRGARPEYRFCELEKGGIMSPMENQEGGHTNPEGGQKGGNGSIAIRKEPVNGINSNPSDSVPSSVESSKTPDPRHSLFVKKHSELYCLKNHCAPPEVPWGPRDAKLLSKVLKEHPGWSSSFLERILTHKFQSKKGLADPPTLWMGSMIRYLTGPLDEYGTVLARQAEAPRATDDLADAIRQRGGPDALKRRAAERNG